MTPVNIMPNSNKKTVKKATANKCRKTVSRSIPAQHGNAPVATEPATDENPPAEVKQARVTKQPRAKTPARKPAKTRPARTKAATGARENPSQVAPVQAKQKAAQTAPLPNRSPASNMPQSPQDQKILLERAQSLAQEKVDSVVEISLEPFACFHIGATERYGIPFRHIETILDYQEIAVVPCTPAFIIGVINYRGELLTVIDPKHFFRTAGDVSGGELSIIVVSCAGMTLGLLADKIEGNDAYDAGKLAAPMASDGVSNPDYVLGIHAGRITILNMEALVMDPVLTIEE